MNPETKEKAIKNLFAWMAYDGFLYLWRPSAILSCFQKIRECNCKEL